MSDKIEVPPVTKILSLDEARAAIKGKVPDDAGLAGMKRTADREFVLTTSLTVATGVAERVYNLMSEQQAEGLAKVEFMCMQHVNKLREEIEARTLLGRLRRFRAWIDRFMDRLVRYDQEKAGASPYVPDPYLDVMAERVTHADPADIGEAPVVARKPEGIITGLTEQP